MTTSDAITGRAIALARLWSFLAAALGALWAVWPRLCPLGANDIREGASLLQNVPVRAGALVLLALGVAGILAAGLLRTGTVPFLALGAAYAVGFGLLVPDSHMLILFAYVFAVVGPLALVVALVVGALRSPRRALITIGVIAALVVLAVVTGLADGAAFHQLANAKAEPGNGPSLLHVYLLFFMVGGGLWAFATVTAFRSARGRCGGCGRPGAAWTEPAAAARWGRKVTIVAALCPMVYGLLRLTWLTPWPLGFDPAELERNPGIRLFGLLLGAAAIGGGVLTLGLIQRWGETWPRWVPALHGRPVPVLFPVILGGTVAYLFCVASTMVLAGGNVLMLLVFPFPIWGPLLAAAVVAYYFRRRGACRRCTTQTLTPA